MNMWRRELIGLRITVINAINPALIGINGKVVDETKNTIKVMHKKVLKRLIKNQIKMKVRLQKRTIELDGKDIAGRLEERIKK
ncbi:MAG: ribonuclease P protein subunit [Nanoarchaeota archaeon]